MDHKGNTGSTSLTFQDKSGTEHKDEVMIHEVDKDTDNSEGKDSFPRKLHGDGSMPWRPVVEFWAMATSRASMVTI